VLPMRAGFGVAGALPDELRDALTAISQPDGANQMSQLGLHGQLAATTKTHHTRQNVSPTAANASCTTGPSRRENAAVK
jgi:hypothetical protein